MFTHEKFKQVKKIIHIIHACNFEYPALHDETFLSNVIPSMSQDPDMLLIPFAFLQGQHKTTYCVPAMN